MTRENFETDQEQRTKGSLKGLIIYFAVIAAVVLAFLFCVIPSFIPRGPRNPQAEAKCNLAALYTTQVAYFGEYGTYAGGPDCFTNMGWGPEGDTRYTYWCGEDFIAPTKPGEKVRECVNVEPGSLRRGFTICAAGNIDRDDTIDTWSISDSHRPRNDQDDAEF